MAKKSTPRGNLAQLENTLEEYFGKKAPTLPTNIKDLLVAFAPWLTLLAVVMGLPAILTLLGLGSMLSMMSLGYGMGMAGYGPMYTVSMVFFALGLVLDALAIPGLFAKSRQGWQMVFYASLVNALYSLISFNIGGLVIGTGLSLYILFQVKSYYK